MYREDKTGKRNYKAARPKRKNVTFFLAGLALVHTWPNSSLNCLLHRLKLLCPLSKIIPFLVVQMTQQVVITISLVLLANSCPEH